MSTQKHRSKMFFIFIVMLSINTCQTAGQKNSTQMHYATLTIDQSVLQNITAKLSKFFVTNSSLQIKNLHITTNCNTSSCHCETGYSWSETTCKSNLSCCGKNSCFLSGATSLRCISDYTVLVAGTITMTQPTFQTCLTDKTTESFQMCNKNMIEQIKKVYTTIEGFDTLTINGYSLGSIIVSFGITIVSNLKPQDLIDRSIELSKILNGSFELQTTGLVEVTVPSGLVHYHTDATVNCITKEDLGAQPLWNINNGNGVFLITNGTVSTVSTQQKQSTVTLQQVDELWEGVYICLFVQQNSSVTIYHTANATMNICLIPKIRNSTNPAYPRCKSADDVLLVTIICEIDKTSENYTVTWSEYASAGRNTFGDRTYTYTAQKVVSCGNAQISTKAEASCNFTNKCAQTVSQSFVFTIIRFGEQYCAAEGDWQDTKAGFTAEIKCINQAGSRKRPCNNQGNWGPEVSECVNQDLHDVLQFAHISDNGLGELDANAAQAFSRFNNVTRTATLATVANVNTSVEVLQTLNSKIKSIQNVSAIDNFLSSSSNLLNETLQSSWNSTTPDTNFSMADTYLRSVEELVKKANISDIIKKANIEVVACRNDSCNNTVFNVTISLQSSSTVKVAGFKYLQTYFSSRDNTTEPNSIVVSATTEEKDAKQDITIDFRLLKDRPRNVEIRCVFRDSNESDWSSNGCHWAGPDNQKRCICHHLSSFAILMSKEPLKVPFLDEITYVGLGVSVLSLFISLLIEFVVWKDVVKTNTLHLRHTAHVNISLCLLVADACFLASSESTSITEVWCRTSAVLKHFCYLAMFFWMLCLSTTLLHQAVFLFHKVSKTNYLRFSLALGYGCPLIIVFVTFLTNNAGGEGVYYSRETCWLVYTGLLQGSIFTFIIPLSVIVFVNVFSMLVVIMKLLSHHQNADTAQETEKAAAKTVLRSVILLTPIFGITWIFGLAIMIIDLTNGVLANVINYTFVVLNSFQGLFILLTSYLCDKNTREALMKRLRKKAPVSSMSESTTSTTKTNLESFKK